MNGLLRRGVPGRSMIGRRQLTGGRHLVPDGRRQNLTIPLHRELASGTLRAIFRQARRFAPKAELRPLFFMDG